MIEVTLERRKLLPTWLAIVIVLGIVYNGLPFLAPVFMKLGWAGAGQAIYWAYTPMCHQMAQRSFFLFGPGGFQMYSFAALPVDVSGMSAGEVMVVMRRFTGSDELGWKVAWSDRMVYMYVAPLVVAVVYAFLRRRGPVKPLPLWAFFALLLPMAIDGGTHWVSDIGGLMEGFRYHNTWLAELTNYVLPTSFYVGDAFGSFNSLMRLMSGVTFGIAIGGLLYPYLDMGFGSSIEKPPSTTPEVGLDTVVTR